MRRIQVEAGLSLRFPGRGNEFAEGVEIGLLVARLAAREAEFTLYLADATLEQARVLAERFGYRVHVGLRTDTCYEVVFLTGRRRPKLTIIHSVVG